MYRVMVSTEDLAVCELKVFIILVMTLDHNNVIIK